MDSEAQPRRPPLSPGFVGIIAFKFLKAGAFLLLGAVFLRIAHLPKHSEPMEIARLLAVDENRMVVRHLSGVLAQFTRGQVEAIGVAALLIGSIFAAEGTTLAMRIAWAPYFTIALTALGIPPEILEILRRPGSLRRYLLLAVNAAILVFLWKRRNEFRRNEFRRNEFRRNEVKSVRKDP